jgi:CheY-like chemotaxis protein
MTTAKPTRDRDTLTSHFRPVFHAALAPRVLIVAKDEDFRQWARGQLQESGFEIIFVDDGYDASLAVAREAPELIVIDHAVPWCGVMCCLSRVWRNGAVAPLPVLLVAPQATDSFVKACRALGIAVLVRPRGDFKALLHMPASEPLPPPRLGVVEFGQATHERSS